MRQKKYRNSIKKDLLIMQKLEEKLLENLQNILE